MSEVAEEFNRLVTRVEQHQAALGLSDTEFVARYLQYVGSSKTWTDRIKPRDIESFGSRIAKWLGNLRALVAEIDGGSWVEEYYDDLPIAQYASNLYNLLQGQGSDRRCGVLLGHYGVGKSVALRALNRKHPRATCFMSVNETWRESKMMLAIGFARAVNSPEGSSAAATFAAVIASLKANPITVLIDEAHEGGVTLFKMVKALINETRAKFILASYPTAWIRLCNGANDAQAEAQQLLRRTYKPVSQEWCRGVRMRDVESFLRSSLGTKGSVRDAAAQVLPLVATNGCLSTLADAIQRAKVLADVSGEDVTAQSIRAELEKMLAIKEAA